MTQISMNKLLLTILIILTVGLTACGLNPPFGAGEIPDNLKLKATKDKILKSNEIDDIRCSDKFNPTTCVNLGKIKSYDYISDKEVPQENGEDITKRTGNVQFFKKGEEEWTGRFYSGIPFYKVADRWFQTETATTTVEAFNEQTKLSFFEKIIKKVFAIDTFYSGAGDGLVYLADGIDYGTAQQNWDTAHDATDSSNVYPITEATAAAYSHATVNQGIVGRGFLPIVTASLDDTATISSSTLCVYVTGANDNDNDGTDWVNIVGQTTQAATTTLVVADFDQCGAINSPTEGSDDRKDITPMVTVFGYYCWILNATGRGWISLTGTSMFGTREGHDVLDELPSSNNSMNIRYSEYADTTSDPYLLVDYTIGGGTTATEFYYNVSDE